MDSLWFPIAPTAARFAGLNYFVGRTAVGYEPKIASEPDISSVMAREVRQGFGRTWQQSQRADSLADFQYSIHFFNVFIRTFLKLELHVHNLKIMTGDVATDPTIDSSAYYNCQNRIWKFIYSGVNFQVNFASFTAKSEKRDVFRRPITYCFRRAVFAASKALWWVIVPVQ